MNGLDGNYIARLHRLSFGNLPEMIRPTVISKLYTGYLYISFFECTMYMCTLCECVQCILFFFYIITKYTVTVVVHVARVDVRAGRMYPRPGSKKY